MRVNTRKSQPTFSTPNTVITPLATLKFGAEQVSVIHQKMERGCKNPTHTQSTEEVMVLLRGSVTVTVAEKSVTLQEGDTLIVPADTPHSIDNGSCDTAEWIIISPTNMQFKDAAGNLMTPPWAE